MDELLKRKLEALGYGGHKSLLVDDRLLSRLVTDLIQASQAGEGLRKKEAATALQLQLAEDKVGSTVFEDFETHISASKQAGRGAAGRTRSGVTLTRKRCERRPHSALSAGRGAHPRDAATDDGEQPPAHTADRLGRQARALRAHHPASAQAA